MNGYTLTGAELSTDRIYRYALWRGWDSSLPRCMFIGLNPSKADVDTDDPTIRKCVGFAKRLGCGSISMVNLFALRATEPKDMLQASYPVGGLKNNLWLWTEAAEADLVVACWGTLGSYRLRDRTVEDVVIPRLLMKTPPQHTQLHCLGLTKDGQPRHPSRLGYKTELQPFTVRRG